MEVTVDSKEMKAAVGSLMKTLTPAEKKESVPLLLRVIDNEVHLMGENGQFYLSFLLRKAKVLSEGEIYLNSTKLVELLKETKSPTLNIESIPEGIFIFDEDEEMEEWEVIKPTMMTNWLDEIDVPICKMESKGFFNALKELKSVNIKTFHPASEHVLFRLRKGMQLNGRSTNFKVVVTTSNEVEGFTNELTDLTFTAKQVSKLTQLTDGKKDESFSISKAGEFIRMQTNEFIAQTKTVHFDVTMPDVSGMVRKINQTPEISKHTIVLSDWLKQVTAIEKELKKDKEGPRVAKMSKNCQTIRFKEEEMDDYVLINTKQFSKILSSVTEKELKATVLGQAMYIEYTQDKVAYKAVLTLIKEG